MRIAAALMTVIVLALPAALADVRHASMPEALVGSWAESSDGCGADDKTLVVVAAKAYEGADGKCAVNWVNETAGPRGPIYSARLQCAGQAPGTASIVNLIIRPDDAATISIGLDFSNLKAYRKCTAKN